MNIELSFFVPGHPAPGGSKTFFPVWTNNGKTLAIVMRNGRPWPVIRVVDDAGKGNKEWKKIVSSYAMLFMKGASPFTDPVKCEMIFYLRRPQSHYRTGKFAHMLRDDAPEFHTTKPDALKFARSTEDAMTDIVWNDDSGNVRICSEKKYMKPEDREGCAIRLVILRSETPAQVTQP